MTLPEPPVGGVLCAGFGTRMAPITEAVPKPLIPFLNTPILAYSLDHLAGAGATRVGMNLHHLADSIPPVADRLAATMNLDPAYAREWEIMGTGGGIRGIWNALDRPDQTLVIFNGDSVMNIDLLEMLRQHRASEARVTMMVRRRRQDEPGGVYVDEQTGFLGGLLDFRHPDADDDLQEYLFAGVHFIEPQLLADIPLEKSGIVTDVYGPLLEDGERIHTVVHDDFWAALDNPGLLYKTTCRVLDDPQIFDQVPMPEPLADGLYVFNEEGIDDKTKVAGPLLSGAHVETGPQVHIGPHAVLDGVELAEGASVRNALIYGMGRLEGKWHRCMAVAGKVANLPKLDDVDSSSSQSEKAVVEELRDGDDDTDEGREDETTDDDGDGESTESSSGLNSAGDSPPEASDGSW